MADDVTLPGTGKLVATDELPGGRHAQVVKVAHGQDGDATPVAGTAGALHARTVPTLVSFQGALANVTMDPGDAYADMDCVGDPLDMGDVVADAAAAVAGFRLHALVVVDLDSVLVDPLVVYALLDPTADEADNDPLAPSAGMIAGLELVRMFQYPGPGPTVWALAPADRGIMLGAIPSLDGWLQVVTQGAGGPFTTTDPVQVSGILEAM